MRTLLAVILSAHALLGTAHAQDLDPFDLPPLDAPVEVAPPPETTPAEGFPSIQELPPLPEGTPMPSERAPPSVEPPPPPKAERVQNTIAEFSGIDKITGRITSFDVYVNETVQFGALQVTPKVCFTSAANEAPQTDSFVEVDEITLNREIRRIFTGWMFADSPGLNAVEHPVYDVWLKGCKTDSAVPPPAGSATEPPAG